MYDIEMNLGEKGYSFMTRIDLAEHRDQWKAIMNMGMNVWIPKIEKSSLDAKLSAS
jgi:hypothetical protein